MATQLTCSCGMHLGIDADAAPEAALFLLKLHDHNARAAEAIVKYAQRLEETPDTAAQLAASAQQPLTFMGISVLPDYSGLLSQGLIAGGRRAAIEEAWRFVASRVAGQTYPEWLNAQGLEKPPSILPSKALLQRLRVGLERDGAKVTRAEGGPTEFGPSALPKPPPLSENKRFRMLVNERLPAHLLGAAWTVRERDASFVTIDVVGLGAPLLIHAVELERAGEGKE